MNPIISERQMMKKISTRNLGTCRRSSFFCITRHEATVKYLLDVRDKIVHVFSFFASQSEEDKQLQEDLEMMVERLSVSVWPFSIFSP